MLTLYGVYRSRASRPLWLLGETGTPFRHVPVIQGYRLADPQAPDAALNTQSAGYLAVNPMGQIPALTDGDLLLTESMAITLHIARVTSGPLAPATPEELAQAENWAFFATTSIERPAVEITYAYMDGVADQPEGQAIIAAASEQLRRPLARLENLFSSTDYLTGDRFTVADITVAECVRYTQAHPALLAKFPAVTGWMNRCQSRPAFKAMWAARMAEPA